MNEIVQEWLKRAEGDFRVARRELAEQDEYSAPVICVQTQQCVEKTLKAYLILKEIDFPKIHDLVDLVTQTNPSINLSSIDVAWLTQISGNSRYPMGNVTLDDARKAFEICQSVREVMLPLFGSTH